MTTGFFNLTECFRNFYNFAWRKKFIKNFPWDFPTFVVYISRYKKGVRPMKLARLFLLALVMLSLSSCAQSNYKLIQEDGNYYIEVAKRTSDYHAVMPITFQSIDEMIQCIKEGDFSWQQLDDIRKFRPQQNGGIPIINLSNHYEPTLPELVDGYSVLWYGNEYQLSKTASDDKELSFTFRFRDKAHFDRIKKEHNLDTVLDAQTPEPTVDGNELSVTYEFRIGDAKREVTYFSIAHGTKELMIVLYFYTYQAPTPYAYYVYGTELGQYFEANINYNGWIPMDELKQFGIREYEESD